MRPSPNEAKNANVHSVAGDTSVPIADQHRFDGDGLLNSAGRGVVNGRPYGQQLQTEIRELNRAYLFRPAAAAKLRAATKRALGR